MSSLKPLRRGGKEAGCRISFLSKQAVASPKAGLGVFGSLELVSGRSPSGPYFTDTPDRACCQECCLISSPACRLRSPHKEGHCVRLHTPGTCSTEIRQGARSEGVWGTKAPRPELQPTEGPQILEQKEPGPG